MLYVAAVCQVGNTASITHVVFLVDNSGSMECENRIQMVFDAVQNLLQAILGMDAIVCSLVTFDDTFKVCFERPGQVFLVHVPTFTARPDLQAGSGPASARIGAGSLQGDSTERHGAIPGSPRSFPKPGIWRNDDWHPSERW